VTFVLVAEVGSAGCWLQEGFFLGAWLLVDEVAQEVARNDVALDELVLLLRLAGGGLLGGFGVGGGLEPGYSLGQFLQGLGLAGELLLDGAQAGLHFVQGSLFRFVLLGFSRQGLL